MKTNKASGNYGKVVAIKNNITLIEDSYGRIYAYKGPSKAELGCTLAFELGSTLAFESVRNIATEVKLIKAA